MSDPLRDDCERLADIGVRVLAGEPIESFGLTANEMWFVWAYTEFAVGLVVPCPRCEWQRYDRGSCGLCNNTGYLSGVAAEKRRP